MKSGEVFRVIERDTGRETSAVCLAKHPDGLPHEWLTRMGVFGVDDGNVSFPPWHIMMEPDFTQRYEILGNKQ